jgi:hypothetical protein
MRASLDRHKYTSAACAFFACAFIILCCIIPLVASQITQRNYVKTRRSVNDIVHVGMSEQQVYQSLSNIGTINVHVQEKVPCQLLDKPAISDRVEISVHPRDYWQWYPSEFIACFDENATLIYFREVFD